jgi:HSP20 family protein
MTFLTRHSPTQTRWYPIDSLFETLFAEPTLRSNTAPQAFAVDVHEEGNAYRIAAELPGVRKEDIRVDVDGSVVTISAETKQEVEAKEGTRLLRAERTYGKTQRSFRLPEEVDQSKGDARFVDGVLEVRLPKKASNGQTRLAIL